MNVKITKHHGLGNDFLVLDLDQLEPEVVAATQWSRHARNWCDRSTGIGADGLLLLGRVSENYLTMSLFNQDGSTAEMSGNGIRCLVHAAYMRDKSIESSVYTVHTDAGDRRVEITPDGPFENTVQASVDMGPIETLAEPSNWSDLGCDPNRPVAHLSVGNPHAVVAVEDVKAVDLLQLGSKIPEINLEVIEQGPEVEAITMRVHERGAGITKACGTGACASAWAARNWGFVPPGTSDVLVHMDGGDAWVQLDVPAPGRTTLIGPSEYLYDATAEMTP